jgi:peptide/nickel transport system ATP-binding protein
MVAAIDDVSFSVSPGEIFGIVGESGSGKTTTARAIARLIDPDSGAVQLEDLDFSALAGADLRRARSRLQVVFQDPYSSLNPRRRIGDIIAQGLKNKGTPASEAFRRAEEMLELVGLPRSAAQRFPNAFSGGQRQRICIARALVVQPSVLIADEAVSSLDVSVQAQILTLLREIRDRFDLSVIFITHDLRVAAELCDWIMVMKDGKTVEQGPCADVLLRPKSDYTQSLINAIPGRQLLNLKDASDHSAVSAASRPRTDGMNTL